MLIMTHIINEKELIDQIHKMKYSYLKEHGVESFYNKLLKIDFFQNE